MAVYTHDYACDITNPSNDPSYKQHHYAGRTYDRVAYVFSGTSRIHYVEHASQRLCIDDLFVYSNRKKRKLTNDDYKRCSLLTCRIPPKIISQRQQDLATLLTCDGDLFIRGLTFESDCRLWKVLDMFLSRFNRLDDVRIYKYLPIGTLSNYIETLRMLQYRPGVPGFVMVVNKLLCLGYYFMGAFSARHQRHSLTRYLIDLVLETQACWSLMKQKAKKTTNDKIKEAFACCERILMRSRTNSPNFLCDKTYINMLETEHIIAGILCECPTCRPTHRTHPALKRSSRRGQPAYRGLARKIVMLPFNVVHLVSLPEANNRILHNLHASFIPIPMLHHATNLDAVVKQLKYDRFMSAFYDMKVISAPLIHMQMPSSVSAEESEFMALFNNMLFTHYLSLQMKKFFKLDFRSFFYILYYYMRLCRRMLARDSVNSCIQTKNCFLYALDTMLTQLNGHVTQRLLGDIIYRLNVLIKNPSYDCLYPFNIRSDTSHQARVLLDFALDAADLYTDDEALRHVYEERKDALLGIRNVNFNRYTLRYPEWFMPAATDGFY